MIPELHRAMPPQVFGPAIARWADRVHPPRAIRKYGCPYAGERVLDVGAYIGEFAIPAAVYGSSVIALEPSRPMYRRLRSGADAASIHNLTALNRAAWPDRGPAPVVSNDATADTALAAVADAPPDTTAEALPLADVPGIGGVDFLKVDAEGAEPEVLASLDGHRPTRVAVDVSPERHGESTRDDVLNWFDRSGYDRVENRPPAVVVGWRS